VVILKKKQRQNFCGLIINKMETILEQKFRYSDIQLYKNYNNINDNHRQFKNNGYGFYIPLNVIKLKHKSFFNSGNNEEKYIELFPTNKKNNKYDTISDKTIKRHFVNPFSTICCYSHGRTIKQDGDIIKVYYWTNNKVRSVNHRFFKRSFSIYGITINLKNGNIYSYSNYNARARIRCNKFNHIQMVLNQILHDKVFNNESVKKAYNINFNKSLFIDTIKKYLNFEWEFKKEDIDIMSLLLKKFVELKKIKVPNNYSFLIQNCYPTEKFLKKNDRKLVSSVLDMLGIKSDFAIKKVHQCETYDLFLILSIKHLYGDSYLKYLPNITLLNKTQKYNSYVNKEQLLFMWDKETFNLSNKEKNNLTKILNDFSQHEKLHINIFQDFVDHFKTTKTIKDLGLEVKPLSSTTYDNWLNEHHELSNQWMTIKKGYTTEFVFDDKLKNKLENVILVDDVIYQPIILKKETDYFEEGKYMHHCVGSYSQHDSSMIISLRKWGNDERVTSEFGYKDGKCKQSRYFSNQIPPKDFEKPLDMLYEKVLDVYRSGELKILEKRKVKLEYLENIENSVLMEDFFPPF